MLLSHGAKNHADLAAGGQSHNVPNAKLQAAKPQAGLGRPRYLGTYSVGTQSNKPKS